MFQTSDNLDTDINEKPILVEKESFVPIDELDNILLKVETIPVDQFICNVFVIDTYMIQYNVLTIVGGVGGLKLSVYF